MDEPDLAVSAAQADITAHALEQIDDESSLEALGQARGERISHEKALREIVAAALGFAGASGLVAA
jgi:hypothetical protein